MLDPATASLHKGDSAKSYANEAASIDLILRYFTSLTVMEGLRDCKLHKIAAWSDKQRSTNGGLGITLTGDYEILSMAMNVRRTFHMLL